MIALERSYRLTIAFKSLSKQISYEDAQTIATNLLTVRDIHQEQFLQFFARI